jgi:uncharacterized YigZ family protein
MPTKKPARITEMALAPTAGAKGVDPEDPAPMAHAIKRLATLAARNVTRVTVSIAEGYGGLRYKHPPDGADERETGLTRRHGDAGVPDANPDSDAGDGNGDDSYLTIAGRAEADFTVQGSEFLAHAAPVESVADAEAFIEEIETAYDDATHNVPAYRVRADPFREYSSDDGEPTGSAGKPMLSVLQGRNVENVCVVVTRYFGGTELGVGGLVSAYSGAVKDVLDAAETIEERPHETFSVTVDYDDSGTVRGILESEGVDFEADYGEAVAFDVRVPVADAEALRDRLRSATSGRADP